MRLFGNGIAVVLRIQCHQGGQVGLQALLQRLQEALAVVRVLADHCGQAVQVVQLAPRFVLAVRAYAGQALAERAQADRLEQAVVHAGAQALAAYLRLCVGGVAENGAARPPAMAFLGAYGGGQLVAVHVRHVAVEHQHIEVARPPGGQAFATVAGAGVLQPQVAKLLCHQLQVGWMVVDHQHVQPWVGHIEVLYLPGRLRRSVNPLQWHLQSHLGADILQALDGQAAAHHFAQVATDGQAQPGTRTGALAMRVGLDERVEQALQVICVDADAAVAYFQLQHGRGGGAVVHQADADAHLAMLGKLDGVAYQVGKDLLEAQGVKQGMAACGRCDHNLQGQAFLPRLAFENAPHRFDQGCKVDGLRGKGQVPRLDAHDVEDIADQAQQVLGRMVGQFQRAAVYPALVGALDCQLEHADDRIHRGTDFMADGGQERAFGAVRIVGLLLGLAQLHDQMAAFADVDPATDDALYHTQ